MATPTTTRRKPASVLQPVLIGAAACVVVAVIGYLVFSGPSKPKRAAPVVQIVNIQAPPPPPPPPKPKPPEQPRPEEMQQPMISETAPEPEAAPAPVQAANDGPLGTGIKGDGGPDSFGLGTGPGGGGGGRVGGTGTGGGGTRWAGYSSLVKNRILEALRADPRTRSADFQLELGIWLDVGGRITRVSIRKSSADPAVEAAISNEVLAGLQIQPPPGDMPQPIWLRTTLRRPN